MNKSQNRTEPMIPRIIFRCTLFVMLLVLALFSNSFAAGYPGFRELNDEECVVLDEKDIQKLPPAWHKYKGFVKICGLKKNKTAKANISIISIWANDYLDSQKKTSWEDFPRTVIVDDHFNQLGTLPELYPMDSPSEPIIYYGRWKKGIPTAIRIDVYNPAVSGDYYYAPLIWNEKTKKYYMKETESVSGKRKK
jgi:hypothetical protein